MLALLSLLLVFSADPAYAAGKKKPKPQLPKDGKRVIKLYPVEEVSIELPDGAVRNFGKDFEALITDKLQNSQRFIVSFDTPHIFGSQQMLKIDDDPIPPGHDWDYSSVPAASIKITVDAMTFITGSRGNRMFYGFDERSKNIFNNGHNAYKNDFPMKSVKFDPNWFDRTFDAEGGGPFNSRTGLDIGEGLRIDLLFAWLALKYENYLSDLHLRIDVEAPLSGTKQYKLVRVKGKGFFFDVVGQYEGYSAGIKVARRDAMLKAFTNGINGSYKAIETAVKDLPLTGRIDAVLTQHKRVLLGTGYNSNIAPGVLYKVVEDPNIVIEVIQPELKGALGKVVRGNFDDVKSGMLVTQIDKLPEKLAALSSSNSRVRSMTLAHTEMREETIELPRQNIPKSRFQADEIPKISIFTAIYKSITETATLLYRIWRFYQYDQTYHAESDAVDTLPPDPNLPLQPAPPIQTAAEWSQRIRDKAKQGKEKWASQIGLDKTSNELRMESEDYPVVAVIDTGIDYNHPALHDVLWFNPSPVTDSTGRKDRYGWDFISGDSRPFDDGYHGTQVASAIVSITPWVKIMPLKIFNPWGITNSAAIHGAFVYAADHGAKIILCGWATQKYSYAVERGVEYAKERGVIVVAAAGDRGDELSLKATYPAVLSARYDNVVTVTGVDNNDDIVKEYGRWANYDKDYVTIAAPGRKIFTALPRNRSEHVTSTGLASALVAGALVRTINTSGNVANTADYKFLISELKADAQIVPKLEDKVSGGRRLYIHE